jgi:hypothetical protein
MFLSIVTPAVVIISAIITVVFIAVLGILMLALAIKTVVSIFNWLMR